MTAGQIAALKVGDKIVLSTGVTVVYKGRGNNQTVILEISTGRDYNFPPTILLTATLPTKK